MANSILLVDDDHSMLTLVSLLLKRHQFVVQTANSGQAALEKLDSFTPDLFILDVMMLGMNGLELCRHLRSREDTADIPIIMLSAKTDEATVQASLDAGANDFVFKTDMTDELIPRVQKLLIPDSVRGGGAVD